MWSPRPPRKADASSKRLGTRAEVRHRAREGAQVPGTVVLVGPEPDTPIFQIAVDPGEPVIRHVRREMVLEMMTVAVRRNAAVLDDANKSGPVRGQRLEARVVLGDRTHPVDREWDRHQWKHPEEYPGER